MASGQDDVEDAVDEAESHGHHDPEGTTHQAYRWKWLSTVLAVPIGLSYPALVVAGASTDLVALNSVPQAWWLVYTTGWLAVLVYTFGADTLKAVSEARGGAQ